MLPELRNSPGLQAALPTIISVLKVGLDDKIAQVFFSCLALIEALLEELAAEGAPKSQVAPMFDGVINRLLGKLADGQVRLRRFSLPQQFAFDLVAMTSPHTTLFVILPGAVPRRQQSSAAWHRVKPCSRSSSDGSACRSRTPSEAEERLAANCEPIEAGAGAH